MKKEQTLEQIKETIKDSTHVQELFEISDDLWNRYFLTKDLTSAQKKEIRELYNLAATAANKHAGAERLIKLTSSTKWEPKKDESTGNPIARVTLNIVDTGVKTSSDKPKVTKKSGEGGSIIQQILAHHKAGKTNKEIVAAGFNKSTVNRQVSEYKKRIENGTEKA